MHEICTALNSQQQFLVRTSSTYTTVGAPGYYCISSQMRRAQAVSLPRMSDRRAAEASTYIKHTSMPSAAFKPAVLRIELAKTYALDRAATAVTYNSNYFSKFTFSSRICFESHSTSFFLSTFSPPLCLHYKLLYSVTSTVVYIYQQPLIS